MSDIPIEYQVDKGVPIPVRRLGVVPLASLEAGDSVLFPSEDRAKVQSYASQMKRRTGKEFVVKKVSDTQCRVWRTR
jgi:hypothetical protein